MKVRAPGLTAEMDLQKLAVRDGKLVIVCRAGTYDAEVSLLPAELRRIIGNFFRPSLLLQVLRLIFH